MKKNILDYFCETVLKKANEVAIIENSREVTFGELDDYSKKLSILIRNLTNNNVNKPIAIYLDKSIEAIFCNIGILYSKNIYMNLDIKNPKSRISNILGHIEPILVITNNKYVSIIQELYSEDKILNLDNFDLSNIEYDSSEISRYLENQIDTDPKCIINTSGSTGIPKGVVLSHKNFLDFSDWAIHYTNIKENDIIGSLSPIIFDIYSFELTMLMRLGTKIVIIPNQLAAFPAKVLDILSVNDVSFIFWVPTIMVNIANFNLLDKIKLPNLKSVWFAGEVFPTKQFNYWRKYLPTAQFINLYGPIEITLDCTYYIVDREFKDDEPLPIGIECTNVDVFLLNENNELCGVNEPGEICVRGTSLALGYYNDLEKTKKAFVQNPLNNSYPEKIYRTGDIGYINEKGEIYFKGRKDTLIKHLGYRIELAEIEHVIVNNLDYINNACCIYNNEEKNIVLYYESIIEDDIRLRKDISVLLPKYMVPNKYIKVEKMPMNMNGKIDRLKLKEMC